MIGSVLIALVLAAVQSSASTAELRGLVVDENAAPVAGAVISIRTSEGAAIRAFSDETGHFLLSGLPAGAATVTATKTGFFQLKDAPFALTAGVNETTFTMAHEQELHERLDVISPIGDADRDTIPQEEILTAREIREIPVPSSNTLQNALPALGMVVQDASGKVHVAGAESKDTQYLLDGFEVGDPLTGEFSARLNVDGVQTLTVQPGQLDARYAHPGASVVNIETQTADDHWRFTTTNFLPDLSFQSGIRLGSWYPRFTFSGPLVKGRVWFSDALSWQHNLEIVPQLPRKQNAATRTAVDNLMRVRFKVNNVHLLESSFLWNSSKNTYNGLAALAPAPTTTTDTVNRYLISLKDQISLGRTLIELGVARDTAETHSIPQGSDSYSVWPDGPRGNYFETSGADRRRWQWIGNVFLPSRRFAGTHDLQAGFKVDHIHLDQDADRRPIQVFRSDLTLSRESFFSGPSHLALSNVEGGIYGQDSWRVLRSFVVQLGSRLDWDRTIGHVALRPSVAFDWLPLASGATKIVGSFGIYSERTDLSLFSQALDQQRIDYFYPQDPAANLTVRQTQFMTPHEPLRMPHFTTTTVGLEQQLPDHTRLQVHGIYRDQHSGFAFENGAPGAGDWNVFFLRNSREDRYRAIDVFLAHSISDKAEFSVDYIRSVARSNQVLEYSVDQLQGGTQSGGHLAWDAPTRLVSHGSAQTNVAHLLLSYFLEYRTGFPFSIVDSKDEVVGLPDRLRLPTYWNLNVAAEKRLKWRSREWAVRVAVINVTGHDNANSVINNIDSPNFLGFSGGQHRAFTARLRLVGRH
jgi:hypothetical protein